jgi:hypothetical protein
MVFHTCLLHDITETEDLVPLWCSIPETARVCRITHTQLAAGEQAVLLDRSKGSDAQRVTGEDAIRSHLSNLNREVGMLMASEW